MKPTMPTQAMTAASTSCCCSSRAAERATSRVLALAAGCDQLIGQLVDLAEMALGALDEHQRRACIAVRHVDGVRRLLDVTGDRGAQLFENVVARACARRGLRPPSARPAPARPRPTSPSPSPGSWPGPFHWPRSRPAGKVLHARPRRMNSIPTTVRRGEWGRRSVHPRSPCWYASVCRPAAPSPIRIKIRKAGASCTFHDIPTFLKRPSMVYPKAWRAGGVPVRPI